MTFVNLIKMKLIECYIHDLLNDEEFSQFNGMGDLAQKLVARGHFSQWILLTDVYEIEWET